MRGEVGERKEKSNAGLVEQTTRANRRRGKTQSGRNAERVGGIKGERQRSGRKAEGKRLNRARIPANYQVRKEPARKIGASERA